MPATPANRVEGMADTQTTSAKLGQAALVTEIEKTRAELARTIDAITDRVSPSKVAQRTSAQVRDRLGQVDPLVGGAVALAAVSVTCYLVWRRLKRLFPGVRTTPPETPGTQSRVFTPRASAKSRSVRPPAEWLT